MEIKQENNKVVLFLDCDIQTHGIYRREFNNWEELNGFIVQLKVAGNRTWGVEETWHQKHFEA